MYFTDRAASRKYLLKNREFLKEKERYWDGRKGLRFMVPKNIFNYSMMQENVTQNIFKLLVECERK